MKRPDTPAIMGLIGLAALLIVGWVVLTVAGEETPPEAWVALSGVVGIIGGWVGKTLMAETPPAPEVVPTPVVVDVEPAAVLPTSTPAVYPLPHDPARKENHDATA